MLKNVLRIAALTCLFSAVGWSFQVDLTPAPGHGDGAHSGITRYPHCWICGAHLGTIQYWVPYVATVDPSQTA